MKKIFILILLLSQISFAGEALSGLEAIFLKISSKLFFVDYENEKNITNSNKNNIEEINRKLLILDKNMKQLNSEIIEVKKIASSPSIASPAKVTCANNKTEKSIFFIK